MPVRPSCAAYALAFALLPAGSAHAEPAKLQQQDIEAFARDVASEATYTEAEVHSLNREIAEALAKPGGAKSAARTLSSAHDMPEDLAAQLIDLRVRVSARRLFGDAGTPRFRAEAEQLARRIGANRSAMIILAGILNDLDVQDGSPVDLLTANSNDRVGDAAQVARIIGSDAAFARAATIGGRQGLAALMRWADYSNMIPVDRLALYEYLASPEGLALFAPSDRDRAAVAMWQEFVEAALSNGLEDLALKRFEALPAALQDKVLQSTDVTPMTLQGRTVGQEASREPSALVTGLAMTMSAQRRDGEARAMIARLGPEALDLPIKACQDHSTRVAKDIAGCEELEFDITERDKTKLALLSFALNRPNEDPYLLAEAYSAGMDGAASPVEARVRCRVFGELQFPGLCKAASTWTPGDLETGSMRDDQAELAAQRSAMAAVLPDYEQRRARLLAQAPPARGGAKAIDWSRPTIAAQPPDFPMSPLPAEMRAAGEPSLPRAVKSLPEGFAPVRAEQIGTRVVAVTVSQVLDPVGEVSPGGYWIHLSGDGGRTWGSPLYTGLVSRWPYVVKPTARLPLLDGDTLNLAVDIAEIDTASITYPPVALRNRREQGDLVLTIPLSRLRADSDGDGTTDLVEQHLLLDAPEAIRPFVVGSDPRDSCGSTPSAETEAILAVLANTAGNGALIEPVRGADDPVFGGWQMKEPSRDAPLFLKGSPKDFRCLRSRTPVFVYNDDALEAMRVLSPDFHPIEMPPVILNRDKTRGFVVWSAGWTGGTLRLRSVNGEWVTDVLSNWIS